MIINKKQMFKQLFNNKGRVPGSWPGPWPGLGVLAWTLARLGRPGLDLVKV